MALDLALAKAHLRVTHSLEDALIQRYMASAVTTIENRAGVLLDRREVTQMFSAWGSRLPLYWGPDPADITIAYVDVDGMDQDIADAPILDGWFHAPATGWPSIASNSLIEATYTAGYTTVPDDLVTAQLLLIQIAYERRVATGDETRALDAHIDPYRHVPV